MTKIKWHKLLNEESESRIALYEVLIPDSPHSDMGNGAFVEYYRCNGLELKNMFIMILLNGERINTCFECSSFIDGKIKVQNYVSKVFRS